MTKFHLAGLERFAPIALWLTVALSRWFQRTYSRSLASAELSWTVFLGNQPLRRSDLCGAAAWKDTQGAVQKSRQYASARLVREDAGVAARTRHGT